MNYARNVGRALTYGYREHGLRTHAQAIAFRVLASLVPLTALGLGLLGALERPGVWEDTIGPAIEKRVTRPVYEAIDFSVHQIVASGTWPLIVFAALLLLWHLTLGVRAIMDALNAIHEVSETRPRSRLLLTAVTLAVAIGTCLITSFLLVTVTPRLAQGSLRVLLTVAALAVAVLLLGLAAGLLVRYAPAEQPDARWASAGSALVVGFWLAASTFFGWWAGSVANYKTATGTLTMFLVLTAYVLVSSAALLVGVELDELARREQQGEGSARRA